ncbi:MAG TPA: serine/threonine-protein kinase [Polyangiaceae bacterium]|jgi:serine/threonine-protein kinase|nr:serine/threonine-protein kinase [Polyangiaceae bacterium]
MPAASDPSLAGLPRQLGKYTLVRGLATGGMAELFLAIHRGLGGFEKVVVIKRILPAMNQDGGFIDMLLHEARVAATLSHPNLVQVFDVGMADGAYFIAMEHVHGRDLRAIVRQMKRRNDSEFPLEHGLSVVLGVCAGLGYAHEKRDLEGAPLAIVHRDISPQNVVVTFSGDVKIVDFGIAKSAGRLGEETASGRLKGKVPYMSPEQARGEPIDARSDLFAAGVLLFELTTGRRLFKAASEYETFKLICERDLPLPSSVRPGYPAELEAIVMRALARDPEARWQSAREMQAALEEFVRHGRVAASRTGLSRFMRTLFVDELARHDEALVHDKRLADRIPVDEPRPIAVDSARMPSFGPTAARTLTDAPVAGERPARPPFVAGTLGLVAAVGVAGVVTGMLVSRGSRGPEKPRPSAGWSAVTAIVPPGAGASALPGSAEDAHGVIAIASSPPGAAIFVNGELSARTTPVTFVHVAVDAPYVVSLVAGGYEPVTRSITLTSDDPTAALSVVLQPASP